MTATAVRQFIADPKRVTRASGFTALGLAVGVAAIELLIAPGYLVALVTPTPTEEALASGTTPPPVQVPVIDPLILSRRVNALREEVRKQSERLAELRTTRGELASRLRGIQPNADTFLLDKPQLHSFGEGLGASYAPRGAVAGEAIDGSLSRLLWNPEPAATNWQELRDWDGGDPLFAAAEKALHDLSATLTSEEGMGFSGLTNDPTVESKLKETERAVEAAAQRVDAVQAELGRIDPILETVEYTVDDRAVLGQRILPLHYITAAEFKQFVESALALRRRHRYAMAQLPYFYAQPRKTRWTWPLGALHEAASSYDTWYAWATHPEWYGDSGLRLDPAQYPKESSRTRELHEEFRSVVYWRHCFDNFLWDHVDEHFRDGEIATQRSIDPSDLEDFTRRWAELERQYLAQPPQWPPPDKPERLLIRRQAPDEYRPESYPEWLRRPQGWYSPEQDRLWTALTDHLNSYFLNPSEIRRAGSTPLPATRSSILPRRNP
ncbi:MAG: hypothetical protein KJZ54_02025 [Phycisphaerales bacterium]|nr:hypothetical protein [Phycisphaerales bacterium]